MIRTLFIIALSIATLLTAWGWWFHASFLVAPSGALCLSSFIVVFGWILAVYLSAARLRGLRAEVRREQGLCGECEYDLKGNVTGVCSECGAPITRTIEASQARTGPRHRHHFLLCLFLGYVGTKFVMLCYMDACNWSGFSRLVRILSFYAPLTACVALTVAHFSGLRFRWLALSAFLIAITVVSLLILVPYGSAMANR